MEPGRGREGQVEPRLSPEDAAEARKILHAPEVSTEVKDTVREILVQDQERRLGQLRQEFTDNQGNPRCTSSRVGVRTPILGVRTPSCTRA